MIEKLRTLITISILMATLAVSAQNPVFEKYGELRNVSSVYISKAMIEMQPDLYTKDLYIGKVAGQLDAVYILSTLDNNIKKDMRKDIDQFISHGKYELLMKQKGVVSRSAFYVKKKGDKIKELVMISDGAASLKFILLSGDLTLKDIQNITNYQNTSLIIPMERILQDNFFDINLTGLDQVEDWEIGMTELNKEMEQLNEEMKNINWKLAGIVE